VGTLEVGDWRRNNSRKGKNSWHPGNVACRFKKSTTVKSVEGLQKSVVVTAKLNQRSICEVNPVNLCLHRRASVEELSTFVQQANKIVRLGTKPALMRSLLSSYMAVNETYRLRIVA
jgi:hypothetical protein